MKTRQLVPLAFLLSGVWFGCHAPIRSSPGNDASPSARKTTLEANIKTAKLTTNQVIALARHAAKQAGYDLREYPRAEPFFTHPASATKWTVWLGRQPAIPDDYIFVIVDDVTGGTEVIRP